MMILLPILIAMTVMLIVWGVWQLIAGGVFGEQKKLVRRLSTEGSRPVDQPDKRSTVRLQTDVTGFSAVLIRWRPMAALYRRILYANPTMTLTRFLAVAITISIFSALIVGAILGSMLMGVLAGGIGGYVPFFLLNNKRNKRQKLITQQIPESLDFLSRILKAGHSLSTGLQMMSQELPQPIATEFGRCYDQHSLGQSLEDCLRDMAARIDSTDFAFFVTAVLIQRQTGGDLSEVLNNISGMIRQRVRLQQHVKAKTAEGRFTGYILVAFPAVMFVVAYVMNPDYASVLLHTSTGLMLLGIAFGLQMAGLFAIRKITTVRV
ncbi:MAG: type II secretion system F family protein [Phycisphaerales bacterium]|jgi:tight adherence protein B|nr:type II secretion system F family protein [Phycisphaerales bacterium]